MENQYQDELLQETSLAGRTSRTGGGAGDGEGDGAPLNMDSYLNGGSSNNAGGDGEGDGGGGDILDTELTSGDAGNDNSGSGGDAPPPPSAGGGDGGGGGDAGGGDGGNGSTEAAFDQETPEGRLFAYGPVSVLLSEDYKTVKQASLQLGGQQGMDTTKLSVKKNKEDGYTIAGKKIPPIQAGQFGSFAYGSIAIRSFEIAASSTAVSIKKLKVNITDLSYGDYASLSDINLDYDKKGFKGSAKELKASLMGYGLKASGGLVEFGENGSFQKVNFASISRDVPKKKGRDKKTPPAGLFEASGAELTAQGLSLSSVAIEMPEVLGQVTKAQFANIEVKNGQGVSGQGQVDTNAQFSFLENKLQVTQLGGKVDVNNDAWDIAITGQILSQLPANTQASGQVTLGYNTGTGQTSVDISGGQFTTDLSGLKLAAEGLSYQSDTQTLGIATGKIQVPKINSALQATMTNASYSASNGFNFESISLSAAEGFELLPGLKVGASHLELQKSGVEYSFTMLGAMAELALASFKGGAKVDLSYSQAQGFTGTVHEVNALSPFFELKIANAPFDGEGISIASASLSLQNLGPVSGTQALAQGITYNQTGLTIGSFNAELPKIGDVAIKADVQNFQANAGGISVGSAKVNAAGDLSLFGGKVLVKKFEGDVNFDGQAWGFNAAGDMSVNMSGFQGSGAVSMGYENGAPKLSVANGQIEGKFGSVDLKASELGLDYTESKKALSIGKADVKVNDLPGLELDAQANNTTIDEKGFNTEGIVITSKGVYEPLKGFKIKDLSGGLKKQGDDFLVDMNASKLSLSTKTITGNVTDLRLGYGNKEQYLGFKRMDFSTPIVKGYVTQSEFSNEAINMDKAAVLFNANGPDGKPLGDINKNKISIQGLSYGKEGFSLASATGSMPNLAGKKVTASVQNLNVPAEGGITGSGTLTIGGGLDFASGGVSVSGVVPYFDIQDDAWQVGAKGGLAVNTPGINASGEVDVYYGEAGPQIKITNGALEGSLLNGAMTLKAETLGFDSKGITQGKGGLTIEKGTIGLPKLPGGGIEAEIGGMSISGKGFGFKSVALNGLGQTLEIIPGLKVTVNSATASKTNGGALDLSMGVGVDLNRQKTPAIRGSATGKLDYNTATGFSGSVNAFTLKTGLFKAAAKGITFDSKGGLAIQEARIGLGESITSEKLAPYFPALKDNAWLLDYLQGVELVGEDITYNAQDGLKMGFVYPNIPPIKFNILGMDGEIDLKEQKGSLMANKRWDLADFKIPTKINGEIPIVPGISGTFNIGIDGHLGLGAGLSMQRRRSDNAWLLNGGINLDGRLALQAGIGMKVGNDWLASAEASINAEIATLFKGHASLGTAIKYDSKTKSMNVVDPIRFDAGFNAKLITALFINLKTKVLGGWLWDSTTRIDLKTWELGSMDFRMNSVANDFGSIFSNMKMNMKFFDGGEAGERAPRLVKEYNF